MTSSALAIWPPSGSAVSLASYAREVRDLVRTLIAPPPFPEGAAEGSGQIAIVVPGFGSAGLSTAHLRRFLARQGFAPRSWSGGLNLGPARDTLTAFDRQVSEAAEGSGRKVALIGISLGGVLAREMAKHRPDCVARVITLVSPIAPPVETPLAPLIRLAALRWSPEARARLAALPAPPPVPLTAIVSPTDGVVDWRSCVPPAGDQVETVMVEGFHMTMASNPEAQRIVAARLAGQA
jgi:pimeloyl-ACP methyl ester carboxylesterase